MIKPLLSLGERLDQKAFLNLRLWQFGLQNVLRDFPWYYLLHGFLLHPYQSFLGIQYYRRLVGAAQGEKLCGTLALHDLNRYPNEERFLVAPGFCLKPYDYELKKSTCPVGHFNHQCCLLDKAEHLLWHRDKWPKPCEVCGIAPIVLAAAGIGADVYIMTSAIDIAKHVYLPAMRNSGARFGLFFLCPYSLEPFTFGLATSGIKGAIVTFIKGACVDHEEWTLADIGTKKDQTRVHEREWQTVSQKLEILKSVRCCKENTRYTFEKQVYRVIS